MMSRRHACCLSWPRSDWLMRPDESNVCRSDSDCNQWAAILDPAGLGLPLETLRPALWWCEGVRVFFVRVCLCGIGGGVGGVCVCE